MNVFGTYTDSISTPLLGGECGKRLIPNVIDATAKATPDVECLSVPRSNGNPSAGWKPVSWAQVANAVNYVAHMLIAEAGVPTPGTFPTVAYIGLEDPRYPIFAIGAIKAGYKALFISPRNSTEAQVNLFNKTDCNLLYHEADFANMVQPWVEGRPGMKRVAAAAWKEWVYTEVAPFPYNKSFDEAEWDPFVVLHTSGSTGLPKPVIINQGMLALNDLHRYVPEYEGNLPWLAHWAKFPNTRYLCIFPLFHTGGIAPTILMAFYYNAAIAFRDPSVPITGDNVVEWLRNTGAGWTLIPPAILEQMSRSDVAVQELKKLHAVGFAGGPIAPTPAENLLKHEVKLVNAIGATEYIYMPYYNNPDPTLWPWFIVPSDLMGIDWRPSGQENTYEQVIVRKDKDHPGLQGCFYAFPELQEFSTKDLYRPHPTLANHWTYVGRADDIIVFSNGEKLNPTTIEGAVMGHAGVRGAQVVGTNYFHAALIIEPANHPQTEQEKQQLLDNIWPIVEKVNVETVAHGRISRDYMFLSDPERPFPRAGKGTIQRAMVVKVYSEDIDRIFTTTSDASVVAVDLNLTSKEGWDATMRKLVQSVLKLPTLCMDQNFFAAGADSLQAIQLARSLRASLGKATGVSSTSTVDAQTIYSYPTIDQLANYAYSLTTITTSSPTAADADDVTTCTTFLEKYTHSLPAANPTKPPALTTAQTILITGTTGTLGPYLLSTALSNPNIAHIICLNRDPQAATRQKTSHATLSLPTDFSRVEFHTADLTHPTLALPASTYTSLLQRVDRIVHNAWLVNFNLTLPSFEPSIRGVRHLIDLSAASPRTIPITFISSVSSVAHWPFSEQKVPEGGLEEWTLAAPGYGQSKLLASRVLDAASKVSGIPCSVIRVGQVAGPRGDKGMWNVKEWVPSVIRSSVFLGVLPGELGGLGAGLAWMCVEDVVSVILEVAVDLEIRHGSRYFHAVNPCVVDWAALVPGLCEFYAGRIHRVVSFGEWVGMLERSLETMGEGDVERNPGVKLLSTFKKAAGGVGVKVGFETARTEMVSPTLQRVGPVTPELMRHWCEQWQF
ncbi:acetyl-CoA synthetase-like protein [Aspergillus saccharolyticus JOP 1030-1]|uniref:Acetyl-CoA synthetase-like protein n=1 Tax=Aspergillus saccharolyticus JOP 1030-1 TaxID=1450539 RepID=A0A318ZF72_9EURO|nr:acetyl-CoA synthetase-like protein [Aspergillus saccharolyticus JOP 1030-1]PYH46069.1 acetyl-CoA synthetase-like protein [Aspergillus saccharolyticus JOP 1030-1]